MGASVGDGTRRARSRVDQDRCAVSRGSSGTVPTVIAVKRGLGVLGATAIEGDGILGRVTLHGRVSSAEE